MPPPAFGGAIIAMLVATPETLTETLPKFKTMLSGFDFKTGRKYSEFRAGDKIANLIPYPVLTGEVQVVDDLNESSRKAGGFGSTGR